jgi:diacylglycerol kinase (ATP)
MDEIVVIANPQAGTSKGVHPGDVVCKKIQELGFQVLLKETSHAGHAVDLAREAAKSARWVAALGGDGTIHEVARGLLGTQASLLVLPAGSGNDFAAGIGISSIDNGLASLVNGKDEWVDVCSLNGQVFFNTAGFLGSGLVSGKAAGLWRWLGRARYTLASVATLLSYHGQDVVWKIQGPKGTNTLKGRYLLAEVCNGPFTGGGFNFTPDASFSDGLFDVCLIEPLGVVSGLKLLPGAVAGKPLDHEAVSLWQGVELELESSSPVAYHLDGEPGVLPAGIQRIVVHEDKLLVRVPA